MEPTTTNRRPPISFRLKEAEEAELDQDARAMGVTSNEFARQVVLQRHEQEITLSPDADRMRMSYEARMAVLVDQNNGLLDRLQARQRDEQLAGIEQETASKANKVELTYAQFKKKYEEERLAERYTDLQAQHKLLTDKYNDLEKEVDELETELERFKSFEFYAEKGVGAVTTILEKAPHLQERLANSSLGQLLLGGTGEVAANLTQEQQEDLTLGTAIRHDFPGETLGQVAATLQFLRDNPSHLAGIIGGRQFQVWFARKQQSSTAQEAA